MSMLHLEEKEELFPDYYCDSKKINILFADNNGIIYISFKKKKSESCIPSRLGKRKLVDAFGKDIYNDKDRYSQDIPDDFFKCNMGHGVY
jgi:hypothetical protein